MRIGEKLGAAGKPGSGENLPINLAAFECIRLRNGMNLARINNLDMHPLRIAVCKVLAVRRNRSAGHRILDGIESELAKLQVWHSRRRTLEIPKYGGAQDHSNDSYDRCPLPEGLRSGLNIPPEILQVGVHLGRGLVNGLTLF